MTSDDDADVTDNRHNVTMQFSWFRHITPLSHKPQRQIVDKVMVNYPKVTTKMIQEWSEMFKGRQALENYFVEHIPSEFLPGYIERLDASTYDKQISKPDKEYIISDSLIMRMSVCGVHGE